MSSQVWNPLEQRTRETPATFLSVGGRQESHSFRFWGDFPMSGMHLLPCEGPSTAGGPRKVLPGWSRASTPVKACRELQERGDATGTGSSLQISVCHSSNQKAPNPARLAPACRGRGGVGGNPVSAQPVSGETLAVHLKVPAPLTRGKTLAPLAPPDLGFQPSPGTASTPRQHPSKS